MVGGREAVDASADSEVTKSVVLEYTKQVRQERDFAMTYGKMYATGKDIAVFDIYRVSNNKIVEHWMNGEEIGSREHWNNSGKF
jgi:predicted SnoaL-like aldol condensation-catalyzing enzyme